MPAVLRTSRTLASAWRVSTSMPPRTSWDVTGSRPRWPDTYSVLPTRMPGLNGSPVFGAFSGRITLRRSPDCAGCSPCSTTVTTIPRIRPATENSAAATRARSPFMMMPSCSGCFLRRRQCSHRRRQPGTRRTRELLLRAVVIVLDESPNQARAVFVIQAKHPEFNELIWDDSARPDGADDSSFVVFLEIDPPAWLEFEVIDVDSARDFAFDPNRRHLLLVGNAHGVFLARALRRFRRQNPDMGERQVTGQQRHRCAQHNAFEPSHGHPLFVIHHDLRPRVDAFCHRCIARACATAVADARLLSFARRLRAMIGLSQHRTFLAGAVVLALAAGWHAGGPRNLAAQSAGADNLLDQAMLNAFKWRSISPDRGGRAIAVSGVKGRPREAYFGAVGGGLWKTVDGGARWAPVTDGQINSSSVGAVAVSESRPDEVFIGMGESCSRGNIMPGDGVYKSADAGKTWMHVGFSDSDAISKIRIHPANPDVVFIADFGRYGSPSDERGLYKSTDGGKTWQRKLFRDGKTGA